MSYSANRTLVANITSDDAIFVSLSGIAAHGASFDSSVWGPLQERECLEGTRKSVFEQIEGALQASKSTIIWLSGSPGTGKSAIAHTVARRLKDHEPSRLAGSFFFHRKHKDIQGQRKNDDTPGEIGLDFFVPTLAYQIAKSQHMAKYCVVDAIRSDPVILDPRKSLVEQFRHLIVKPLQNLLVSWRCLETNSKVLVIDAVDICEGRIPELISCLSDLLRVHEPPIPNVHILITGRPHAAIDDAFEAVGCDESIHRISLDDVDVAEVHEDICLLFKRALQKSYRDYDIEHLEPELEDETIRCLADKVNGNFRAALAMINFLDANDGDSDTPCDFEEKLKIMKNPGDKYLDPPQVYRFYEFIINSSENSLRAYTPRPQESATNFLTRYSEMPDESETSTSSGTGPLHNSLTSSIPTVAPDTSQQAPLEYLRHELQPEDEFTPEPSDVEYQPRRLAQRRYQKAQQTHVMSANYYTSSAIVDSPGPSIAYPPWSPTPASLPSKSQMPRDRESSRLTKFESPASFNPRERTSSPRRDFSSYFTTSKRVTTKSPRMVDGSRYASSATINSPGPFIADPWSSIPASLPSTSQMPQDREPPRLTKFEPPASFNPRERASSPLRDLSSYFTKSKPDTAKSYDLPALPAFYISGPQNSSGEEWQQTQQGRLDWLQSSTGREWLQTLQGLYWLQSSTGRQWLQSSGGERWLQTLHGLDWLQSSIGRERLQSIGKAEWLHTRQGLDWLHSSIGQEWLQRYDGEEWLETQQGLDWLRSSTGREWLQSGSGEKWLTWQLTTKSSDLPSMDPHWQLLPYDHTRSKRFIHFDISFPTDDIEYRQISSHGIQRIPLSDADLDKPAADKSLTQITIKFRHDPFEWDIDVKCNEGIRARDVFEAIYTAFQEPLTSYEKSLIPYYRYAGYEEAFGLRCKLTVENPTADEHQVWKRIDTLLHETFFYRLTQSKWKGENDLPSGVPIYDLETTASNFPSVIYGSRARHEHSTSPHLDLTLKALPDDAAFFSLPLSAAFVTNTHIKNDDMRASWGSCRICNFEGLNPFLQHGSLCTLIDNILLLSPYPSSQNYIWAYFCRFVPLTVSFDSLGYDALPMIPVDGGLARWIDKLEAYLENPSNTMTWLRGPSGTGKSIIAYILASRLSQKNRLTGSFFFSRRHANCRGARSVLLALAYQLGLSEPQAKEKIIAALDNDPGITLPSRDLREQFVRLLIDPLEAIGRDSPSSSRVFVIDAIEECQDDVLDLILLLARLLARLNDVGVGLQIFITSRDQPAGASIERYVPLRAFDITLIDVAPEIRLFLRESLDDIYTRHCLEYRRPWPTDEVLDHIVDRVGPYFNTASAIVKFVEIPDHDPADMLDLICDLPMTPSSPSESLVDILYKSTFPPASLSVDILYKSIISTSDDVERAYVHLMIVVNLAGMLSCSQLDNLLNRGPSQIFSTYSVLSKLPPLVHVLTSHDSPVQVCHESLSDFLSDPLRCGEQFIPQSMVHRLLAYCSLMVMMEELPDNSPLCFHLSRLATESSLMSLDGFNDVDVLSSVLCSPPEPMQFLDTLWRIMMMQGRAGSTADIHIKLAMGYFCCTWQLLQHLDLSTFGTLPTFRLLAHIRSLPVLLAFPIFLSFESVRNSHTKSPWTLQHEPHIEAVNAVAEIVDCVYALKYGPGCRMGDALDYACTHWAYHLSLAEWDDDLRSILASFMSQKLEQWLVRAWCLQDLETCLRTLCNVRELCLRENFDFDSDI